MKWYTIIISVREQRAIWFTVIIEHAQRQFVA